MTEQETVQCKVGEKHRIVISGDKDIPDTVIFNLNDLR